MKEAKAENLVSNYYVLQRVAGYLNRTFRDMYSMFAFEEADRSLSLGFRAKEKEAFLKVNILDEAFIFFPEKIRLPRQPRKRFEALENARFSQAIVHLQDRSFQIRFEGGYTLVFLLYGRNGNVLLFEGESCADALRKNISTYTDKALSFFDTRSLPDRDDFLAAAKGNIFGAVKELFPAFPLEYQIRIASESQPERAWDTCLEIDRELAKKGLGIREDKDSPAVEFTAENGASIEEILNNYARLFYRRRKEQQEKQRELSKLVTEKKRLEKNIASLRTHLSKLGEAKNYRRQADLLMTNIYAIEPGAEKITVQDFETGKDVELKLKKGLSPQAWAEKLYHKAKGQQKEREITEGQLGQAEQKLTEIEAKLKGLSDGESIIVKERHFPGKKQPEKEPPFRSVVFQGFSIYIGKSAANNDELTFKFAHKEDTWLHARGVSGSHVIIRHKAKGKEIPKPVLEAAASLAAFNSKAKHSSLVPVAYTLRKFVRKPKGSAPGEVIVEKEKVILVEPLGKV